MSRQTVLLLFGGESSEHDVSIMSARNVYAAIDNERYEVELVYIDRSGKWWLLDGWPEDIDSHGGRQLALVPGMGAFLTLPGNDPLYVGIVFPVLHGENGHEDGTIQALAQVAHIRVIGCDASSSVLCWDKLLTKQLLAQHGVPVTPYEVYRAGDVMLEYSKLREKFGPEMFVKPSTAGSSVGVSKVHMAEEFEPAIVEALKYSDTVLVEKPVVGRELEVAVLGNPPHHHESGVGEIISGEEFYSYDDKYTSDSKAQVLARAEVTEELAKQLRTLAHQAYQILGCRGLARVDFLIDKNGDVYLNELNTLPGFTNISQYPKLWQEEGISYAELIDQIIQLANN